MAGDFQLGRHLSQWRYYARPMKLKQLWKSWADEGEVIARFGGATLIRSRDGKWQLRGGSRSDRLAAQEWISLFLHEAVVQIRI